jgi:radical SAM protein with 4Fe4S-binding SPASM domain
MKASLEEKTYPVLSSKVLLNRATSDGNFLGVVYFPATGKKVHINEHLSLVLDYCDGKRTVDSILNSLARKYHEPKAGLKDPLIEVLDNLEREEIISRQDGAQPEARLKVPPVLETPYPLHTANIELTAECNLKCMHCYGKFGNGHFKELTVAEIEDVAKQLKELQVYEVALSGGEPLLRDDFFDIAKIFVSRGFGTVLMTNGSLVDEHMADSIARAGLQSVGVSLDGVRSDTHDPFRGVRGSFQKTMKGIELLNDRGIRLKLFTVLNRLNSGEMKALLQLYRRLEATYSVSRTLTRGRPRENRHLLFSVKEFPRAYEKFLAAEEVVFGGVASRIKEGGREELAQRPLAERPRCHAAIHTLNIRPDGTITPCASLTEPKFAMGNVREKLLKDIWLDPVGMASQIRELKAIEIEKCSDCQLLDQCGSGCMACAYLERGTVLAPDLGACATMEGSKNFFRRSGVRRF